MPRILFPGTGMVSDGVFWLVCNANTSPMVWEAKLAYVDGHGGWVCCTGGWE